MRPPGSNYKNYCSSKLLMSCDVLPTCEEGLGVEKACYPDEDAREGGPQAPRCSLTQAGEEQCTQTTKANKKKDQGHATRVCVGGGGRILAAVGTGSRLEHSFPKGGHHLSDLELPACWGHRGALI